MTLKDLQVRIDQLVDQARRALVNAPRDREGTHPFLGSEDYAALRAAGLAFIESAFGPQHSYYSEFDRALNDTWRSNGERHSVC